jgi:ABC-type polysaccharide/polyol phosphate export permease
VYALALVPAGWRPALLVNPMTLFVVAYREVLIEHTFPALALLSALGFYSVAALAGGYGVFLRGRARLAEHV